jgi:uncharacterized membrane protein (UPF0127 family)
MNRSQTWLGENGLKALAAAMLVLVPAIARAEVPTVPLMIGKHSLVAEVASTESQRGTGLMHRRMLPENRGMLFVFPDIALHGMWMMNTFLPLSVAFIDRDGTIINIADMEPHTTNTHSATRPAKYALEMNQGWFRKRGIKSGDKIQGLEKVPPAR